MNLRLGLDMDGVFADFDRGYRAVLRQTSGRDLLPDTEPTCWDYDQAAGYTAAEIQAAWQTIRASKYFWRDLQPYPGAREFLGWLAAYVAGRNWCQGESHEVCFLTCRDGWNAKGQTEEWLRAHGFYTIPRTVLLAREPKGGLARELHLTHVVDDSSMQFLDVLEQTVETQAYLWARPHNTAQQLPTIGANTVRSFAELENLIRQHVEHT